MKTMIKLASLAALSLAAGSAGAAPPVAQPDPVEVQQDGNFEGNFGDQTPDVNEVPGAPETPDAPEAPEAPDAPESPDA